MSAGRLSALLLDLDGTLLDTAPDMVGALNRLRAEEGRAALPFLAVRPHVSHGAAALVRFGFGTPEAVEFERLRRRFLALYEADLHSGTRLFEGFAAVLETLEARAIPWGIVTNKPGYLTTPLHAAGLIGREPGACVYAGDAERDIVAGRAAGMRTVAVRFGYLAVGEDPEAWRPDAVVARPAELLGLLDVTGA